MCRLSCSAATTAPIAFLADIQNVEEKMSPLLATLTDLSRDLERMVDTRVFVTLLRGLWEHVSDDLYIFVENLQEGHDHHVSLSNILCNQLQCVHMHAGGMEVSTECQSSGTDIE